MIRRLPWLTFAPLLERFRRGEGALLAVNAGLVAFAAPPLRVAAVELVLSLVVLAALYAVNDWRDAWDDRRNPKKNRALVEGLIAWRGPVFVWLCGLQAGAVALAAAALGARTALVVAAMFAVNAAYSWGLKGRPVLDLLVVGLWGAVYAAIVSAVWSLCAMVGATTAIMHVFQIQQDRAVDAANRVGTTAVVAPRGVAAALAVLCAGLGAAVWAALGPAWALSAAVPLGVRLAVADTGAAWMASRIYFAVVFLAALVAVHGLP